MRESQKEKSEFPPSVRDTKNSNDKSINVQQPRTGLVKIKQLLSGVFAKIPGGRKPLYRRYWLWAGFGIGGAIIAVSYSVSSIDRTLPDKAGFAAVVRRHTLTIKGADGSILEQIGPATREQLKLNQIPDKLQKAFIASEDVRFYQHHGVDFEGIARAALSNLQSHDVVEGGSTITQQVARILYLDQEQTLWRKLREARLAQRMEQHLTKNQILERYLNLVYLGSGAYGVADAASLYFSKPVDQLTLGQMATIAGLPPAPNNFSPLVNPEAAKQRRNVVLQRMQTAGYITNAEKQQAMAEPLNIKSTPLKRLQIDAPYFTSYILKELPKYVKPDVLAKGGLTVETTLNPTWQKAADKAVATTLRNEGRWDNFKQAAMVAIDPRNGEIKAMVGGKSFNKNEFNRVTQAKRQPGSTFKGFVYATAIASGMNPGDTFEDEPLSVDGYEPKNFSNSFHGSVTMQEALAKSINIVAVKVLMKVGFKPTIEVAHKMGIESQLQPVYSLALGSSEVNLLELTSGYGSFADQGLHVEPHGITRILNRRGQVIWSANYQPKRALDAKSNAIMTGMLRHVVEDGTGRAAQLDDRPVAGKTGTTDKARDLWFIGFIPQLVTGVWLGNDNNEQTYGESGTAAETWNRFMSKIVKGMPVEKFPRQPNLEGRKPTVKAQPVKPKRLINNPEPDNNQDSNNSDHSGSDTSSRHHQQQDQQTQEETSRPARHHYEADTPRRRHFDRTDESNSTSSNSERPQRQERVESDTSFRHHSESSVSTPNASSPPKPLSWRERLKPTSGSGN